MTTQVLAGVVENIVNRAVSGQLPVAATETIVTGSQINLTRPLAVGDIFQWRVSMTKTGAGTGNSSFKVKASITQTLAAASANLATLAFPVAETAVAGSALVYIEAVVRAISPTTGIVDADLTSISSTAPATGFSNQQVASVATGLVTDSTVLAVGLSITTGAADVVTINYAEARLLG